jgi:hypothetical protein
MPLSARERPTMAADRAHLPTTCVVEAMQTCVVSARDELNLAEVNAAVVQPVIGALLRAGELDEVRLSWQKLRRRAPPEFPEDVPFPVVESAVLDGPDAVASLRWVDVEVLVLSLVARGESFAFDVARAEDQPADLELELLRDEFWSRLQDFIAESGFGWGELRG